MKVRGIPRVLFGAALTSLVVVSPLLASAAGPAGADSNGWFVVGDVSAWNSASTGQTATFWGAQWSRDNVLSGGAAPDSFKGFADQVDLISNGGCGGTFTFTTRPGNSSVPPTTLQTAPNGAIGVLIATSITKSGSTISGTYIDIAGLVPNPGYAPDPGHPGTGIMRSGSMCAGNVGGNNSGGSAGGAAT